MNVQTLKESMRASAKNVRAAQTVVLNRTDELSLYITKYEKCEHKISAFRDNCEIFIFCTDM